MSGRSGGLVDGLKLDGGQATEAALPPLAVVGVFGPGVDARHSWARTRQETITGTRIVAPSAARSVMRGHTIVGARPGAATVLDTGQGQPPMQTGLADPDVLGHLRHGRLGPT